MKIAVDASHLLANKTGIGQYVHHLLREFSRSEGGNENEFLLCGTLSPIPKARLSGAGGLSAYDRFLSGFSARFKVPFPFKKMVRVATHLYTQAAVKRMGIDVFWGPCFFGLFEASYKTVITIHDMAYRYYPQYVHPFMAQRLMRELSEHARRADMILTEAEHTKKDIVRFLEVPEQKIRVIPNGVGEHFRPCRDAEILGDIRVRYRLPARYILFVGMLEPRKNIVGLLKAFAALAKDAAFRHDLVLVGSKGWGWREISRTAKELGIYGRVMCTGYVPDEDLPAIYNMADVFAFPSFYEGFGFPVLEAMACGTPVITSHVSCLPEIGGDAAVYVNPNNIEKMAGALRMVLGDAILRESLRAKGRERTKLFSWENAARQTLKAFEDVALSPARQSSAANP